MTITGQYTAKGSVLILPIVGNGKTNITMGKNSIKCLPTINSILFFTDNLDFHGQFLTSVVNRNGQDYLHLKKVIVNFDTTR